MKPVYIGFDGRKGIEKEFATTLDREDKILLAVYETGNYEGQAFVIFENNGQVYIVAASHCSCYGLEGRWDFEETTVEALRHILDNGTYFEGNFCKPEVEKVVKRLERRRDTKKDLLNGWVDPEDFYAHTVIMEAGPVKISGSSKAVYQAVDVLADAGLGYNQ